MEWINRMRKDKKGFTLVEIIVVLVILAILAAFTIPTMLGFVEDSKAKSYVAEAREIYVAAQATSTEMMSKGTITRANLETALESPAVKTEKDREAAVGAAAPSTDDQKASSQMLTYLSTDTTPVAASTDTTAADEIKAGNAYWTLVLGKSTTTGTPAVTTTTDEARVTEIVYDKGGYEVTIKDGEATFKKIK